MSIKINSNKIWLFLGFFTYTHGAALPEPAAAKISYVMALRQKIQEATSLDVEKATLCAEYVGRYLQGDQEFQLADHTPLKCLALVKKRYLVFRNEDRLEVIDSATQQKIGIKRPRNKCSISALLYKPPFTMVTSDDTALYTWDIRTGEISRTICENWLDHGRTTKWKLADLGNDDFASFGLDLYGGYNFHAAYWDACDPNKSGQVEVWNASNGKCLNQYKFCNQVHCVSPFDNQIAYVGLENGTIHKINFKIWIYKTDFIQASEQPIISLAKLSENELVALDNVSDVTVWNLQNNTQVHKINCSNVTHLVQLNDEIIGIPHYTAQTGGNALSIQKTVQGLLIQQKNLNLERAELVHAVASSQNSFVLATTSSDKKNTLYIFGKDRETSEKKHDDEHDDEFEELLFFQNIKHQIIFNTQKPIIFSNALAT